jgi:H+/Cl- antiporter ClcA
MNSQGNPQADYKNWGESHDISMAYWRSVRASIEHENQLVNYRITWLLAFEALLFGALGIFVKEYLEYMKHGSMPPLGLYFIALVGFVNIGIIAAFYVERYMRGAEDAHDALVKWWRDQCK